MSVEMALCKALYLCERKWPLNNSQTLHLKAGEILITKDPLIIGVTLRSGVSVFLFSPEKKVGGICYYSFPHIQGGASLTHEFNFGEIAIPTLIKEFCDQTNSSPSTIQAKIIGGDSSTIGAENISLAKKILEKYKIPVMSSDVSGDNERVIRFYTDTGRLRVASIVNLRKPKKRVLIIDDSSTMRTLLTKVLSQNGELEIIGTASNPIEALKLIQTLKPDVLTLDIHMPEMDGVTFLKNLLPQNPIPTVMITSVSMEEGNQVLKALELGAVDYIQKPTLEALEDLTPQICAKVLAAASVKITKKQTRKQQNYRFSGTSSSLIAFGSSTGGTEALKDILCRLPKDVPPILISQHIPPFFSTTFAKHLNELCAFSVKEAQNGDPVLPGSALLAPGGCHMSLKRNSKGYYVKVEAGDPKEIHRPSIDILFSSVAENHPAKSIGVILTGMGSDGAAGLLKMRQTGARTIAQDEKSCVIFGMPKEAIKLGAAEIISPLSEIPEHLTKPLRRTRAS